MSRTKRYGTLKSKTKQSKKTKKQTKKHYKKEHSANFLPSAPPPSKSKSTAPIPYTSSASGQFSPFIALDCRGLEFTKFHFAGKWKAEGEESGAAFDIDWDQLRKEQGGEERWDDYDEDGGVAVAVSELKSKIERA